MPIKCPKCQAENRDDSQFCRVFGQSLKIEIKCRQYGRINLVGSKYCDKCGRILDQSTSQPSAFTPVVTPATPSNWMHTVALRHGSGFAPARE